MFFTLCSQPALSTLLYIIFPRHGLFLFSLSSSSLSSYRPQFTFLIKTGRGRVVSFSFSKEAGRGGIKKKFCISASLPPPPPPLRGRFSASHGTLFGDKIYQSYILLTTCPNRGPTGLPMSMADKAGNFLSKTVVGPVISLILALSFFTLFDPSFRKPGQRANIMYMIVRTKISVSLF